MKRYWSGLIAAGAVATTVALGAQSQNPANTPPADAATQPGAQRTPEAPSAQTAANTVTITGCIQNAPTLTASTGARGTAAGRDATVGDATTAGRAATGTTAGADARAGGVTSGAPAGAGARGPQYILSNASMAAGSDPALQAVGTSGTAVSTYQLEGNTAMVAQHLNQQVQVTGTVQASAASPAGAANAAAGSTAAGATLRVESVTKVADTCSTTGAVGGAPRNEAAPPPGRGDQGNTQGQPAQPQR